jgi:hypothetical protein
MSGLTQEQAETLAGALKTMRSQLEWRGPSGRAMGHIVLEREQAIAVFAAAEAATTVLAPAATSGIIESAT